MIEGGPGGVLKRSGESCSFKMGTTLNCVDSLVLVCWHPNKDGLAVCTAPAILRASDIEMRSSVPSIQWCQPGRGIIRAQPRTPGIRPGRERVLIDTPTPTADCSQLLRIPSVTNGQGGCKNHELSRDKV